MKSSLKVCMISTVHSAFDDRIFYKEAVTLAKNGYFVSFIVPHNKREYVNGVEIVPLKIRGSRDARIILSPLEALITAMKTKCKICHFHDPELLLIGVLCKLLGKKVIYDVHEDIGLQILSKNWIKENVRRSLSWIINKLEKITSNFFDAIIAATPFIAKKFDQKKTEIIRNFVILDLVNRTSPKFNTKDVYDNKIVLIYAGSISKNRGIDTIIKSIINLGDNIELWLLGEWENEDFYSYCKSLEGWKYTKYWGHKRMEEVYPFLKSADIGIVLLHKLPNYLNSLPIKAFEYMAAGIPFLASDFEYWKELFSGCALFADPESLEDITHKLKILIKNPDLRKFLGQNGEQLVKLKYNWELESKKLLNIYHRILYAS